MTLGVGGQGSSLERPGSSQGWTSSPGRRPPAGCATARRERQCPQGAPLPAGCAAGLAFSASGRPGDSAARSGARAPGPDHRPPSRTSSASRSSGPPRLKLGGVDALDLAPQAESSAVDQTLDRKAAPLQLRLQCLDGIGLCQVARHGLHRNAMVAPSSAARASSRSRRRAVSSSGSPRAARPRAKAAPIPLDAPVTRMLAGWAISCGAEKRPES